MIQRDKKRSFLALKYEEKRLRLNTCEELIVSIYIGYLMYDNIQYV